MRAASPLEHTKRTCWRAIRKITLRSVSPFAYSYNKNRTFSKRLTLEYWLDILVARLLVRAGLLAA